MRNKSIIDYLDVMKYYRVLISRFFRGLFGGCVFAV